MKVDQIIQLLDLKPHPEGGFYRETYRSSTIIPGSTPVRNHSTAIYYLLVPGAVSKLHKLSSDEVFHFYMGDPVTWVSLKKDGKIEKNILGNDLSKGQLLQWVAPAGTWFGGYLNEGGSFALMGTTVAPGFVFSEFILAKKHDLLPLYPAASEEISRLT